MKWLDDYKCWVFDDGRIATPTKDGIRFHRVDYSTGRPRISLKNKNVFTYRLLAIAFIPNPENKPTVDHIDRNPLNNDLSNLRWATREEQQENRKVCEISVSTYGVRKCKNRKEYNRAWREAHPDYKLVRRARRRAA